MHRLLVELFCRGDVDLNRDFPDPVLLGNSSGALAAAGHEQPETRALMQWTSSTHFVASASLHEVEFRFDASFDSTHASLCL